MRFLVREQRDSIAVDDLHPVAFAHAGPRSLSHRLTAPVVQPDADDVVGLLFDVFFDLVAGISAHARARIRRSKT